MTRTIPILLLLLVAPPLAAQIPADVVTSVDARVSQGEVPGLVVALIENGDVAYYAAGRAALPDGPAVDRHTLFEIGSITKTFTATLLADAVVRGTMHLDDPVARYLSDTLRVPDYDGRPITLYHLATHTSGLPRLPVNLIPADPANPYADYRVADLYIFLHTHYLRRAPGAAYEYSNLGMGLLGHLLARRAGVPYEALLRDRITGPLGMNDTGITLTPDQRARLATGHHDQAPVPHWDLPTLAGAGALRASAADLVQYLRAQMGLIETPLRAAIEETHRPREATPTPDTRIGLAWQITTRDSTTVIWHSGGTGGFRSFAGFDPDRKRGAVVLANSTAAIDDLGFHLLTPTVPLRTVRQAVVVSPALLEGYVGRYELSPTFSITITRDGDHLTGQATGQSAFRLYADSDSTFFLRVVEARVTFHRDAGGQVTGLTLHQNGRDVPGRKVE